MLGAIVLYVIFMVSIYNRGVCCPPSHVVKLSRTSSNMSCWHFWRLPHTWHEHSHKALGIGFGAFFTTHLILSKMKSFLYIQMVHKVKSLKRSQTLGGCTVLNMYEYTWVHRRGINLSIVVLHIHTLNTFRTEKYSCILTLNI
jgi:hypothetical protein